MSVIYRSTQLPIVTFVHYQYVWKGNCKQDHFQLGYQHTIFLCLLNRPYEENNQI